LRKARNAERLHPAGMVGDPRLALLPRISGKQSATARACRHDIPLGGSTACSAA